MALDVVVGRSLLMAVGTDTILTIGLASGAAGSYQTKSKASMASLPRQLITMLIIIEFLLHLLLRGTT